MAKETASVLISATGCPMTFIYNDSLEPLLRLGKSTVQRVSHVEPYQDHRTKEMNGWVADMSPVNGPELGPYELRDEALNAEREWLSKSFNL